MGVPIEKREEGTCLIIPLKASIVAVLLLLSALGGQFAFGVSMVTELKANVQHITEKVNGLERDFKNLNAVEIKLATVDSRLSGVEREVSDLNRDVRDMLAELRDVEFIQPGETQLKRKKK